jgi:DNA polymerase IV (archaeal DinB-like DNA polymerase)
VDIKSFFSSCEEIRNPFLKGKSHAVIMTDQDNNNITKGVVATCSYEAKKFGVQSAMSLYKALKLCLN